MRISLYIIGLVFITAVALSALLLAVFFIDPNQSLPGKIIFFTSAYVMLTGLTALIWLGFRRIILRLRIFPKHIRIAVRQALIIAGLITLLSVMQSQRSLTWPRTFGLTALAALVEYIFQTREGLKPIQPFKRFNSSRD